MFTVCLNKHGYDPYIDFLKGLCIVWVVLTHNLSAAVRDVTAFPYWGSMAVPLFLLIQVFHAYRKGVENVKVEYNLSKLFHRIILPFLVATAVVLAIKFVLNPAAFGNCLHRALLNGGVGPGCYYPWVYVQFFFILPLLARVLALLGPRWGGGLHFDILRCYRASIFNSVARLFVH